MELGYVVTGKSFLNAFVLTTLSQSIGIHYCFSVLYLRIVDNELNRAFTRFKDLADKKKEISNADIESLVQDEIQAAARTLATR